MIYTRSRDRLAAIATANLKWLLLQDDGYVVDTDHDFVANLTPASNEVDVSGYTRLTLTTGARTVNDTLNRVEYTADNPNWGTLSAGNQVTGLVLFEQVTNDADSPLIGYWPLTAVGSSDIVPFVVFFTDHLIATLHES